MSRLLAYLVTLSFAAISLVFAPGIAAPAAGQESGTTVRVSITADGVQSNSTSYSSSLSRDGRHVAFLSAADNLVAGDTNARVDAFVRDMSTGAIDRVNVSDLGAQATGGPGGGVSAFPDITPDARYVAFDADTTNLDGAGSNGSYDVFVRDRQLAQTTRASTSLTNTDGNGDSSNPVISDDGSIVVFESYASNLVAGDTNGTADVFVRDLSDNSITRVSLHSDGTQGDSYSLEPAVSADGRWIAFYSAASNFVAGDTNNMLDIFLHDRVTGTTVLASRGINGAANDGSYEASLSGDGRYVAFWSDANNLVVGDTNGINDVFVYDRVAQTTERVSVSSSGAQIADGGSFEPAISDDGRRVAFWTDSIDLFDLRANAAADVVVHDRRSRTTVRVSAKTDGSAGNHYSYTPAISPDGLYVSYDTETTDLVAGDTNNEIDVLLHRLASPSGTGYWMVAADGGVFPFGDAGYYGSTGDTPLNQPIVAVASTPTNRGYWLVARDGGVFPFGDAQFHGSTGDLRLNQPIVAAIATASGRGYWLVALDGGVFAFGDAQFLGSTGDIRLNQPIVAGMSTPSGLGYWLVARDGGVFGFGDAQFHGSTGDLRLNQPIVAASATSSGDGYWLVAADGGAFVFGDAPFHGSAGSLALRQPIVAFASTPLDSGYRMFASDGGVFSFGDASFLGSLGNLTLNAPIVAGAAS